MARRDYTDILGGALLVAFGLGVGFYAQRYNIGTLTRMGPGFFPAALGFLLALLGLAILLPGLRRTGGRSSRSSSPSPPSLSRCVISAWFRRRSSSWASPRWRRTTCG
jgi:hypothetical protein